MLSISSQIQQITERFFCQSGFFKICHDTGYGMDKFFSFRFKNQLYGNRNNQIGQDSIMVYWRLSLIKNRFLLNKKINQFHSDAMRTII
jgi:hypothetical protein